MADKTMFYPPKQDEVVPCNPICLTCVATVVCSTAKAELQPEYSFHVCNSAFLAERGCLS